MPRGFHLLIAAQFASALADNALLIVTIALLHQQGHPAWWAPLLKFAFTLSYVGLAPAVGPLADAMPKARLMAWMNALKVVGLMLLLGVADPLTGAVPAVVAFAVVGFAAAAYAPAKYGLVTELVPAERLVRANAWIEVSVVLAALLGTVVGGLLVSAAVRESAAALALAGALADAGMGAAGPLALSMAALLVVYGLAAALNLGIPDSGARYARPAVHPAALARDFWRANRLLWSDRGGGRLSLAVTTLFWGVGATLQFAVLLWAQSVLLLTLDRAAYLQAAVAVGVIAGAAFAGRHVALRDARRVLPLGIVLGALIPTVASTGSLPLAALLLAVTGAVGGVLVVPLNALLQHRGHTLLTAGRSIAVQGFNENLSVLVMLAGYAALLAAGVPIVALMWGLGIAIGAAMAALLWREQRSRPAAPTATAPR
jgi:MFS transporter, LPLT family, lysophospholipid transporter